MIPVILSGGSGTRLWPLSRQNYPKQFQSLASSNSLFQETAERLQAATTMPPVVVCNQEHRFIVAEQMREIGIVPTSIILEPEGRNTAPAVAAAAFSVSDQDPLLLICPSDHYIPNHQAFAETVSAGVRFAAEGKFVCFGVPPRSPHTGYGYIQAGDPLDYSSGLKIDRFVEKPPLEKAKKLLSSGRCYWNSGIYLLRASVFLDRLHTLEPCIYSLVRQAFVQGQIDLDFLRLAPSFCECPGRSIDHAVIEKISDGVIVPFSGAWSDLGSWPAVWNIQSKDAQGNVKIGDVLENQTKNCYLRAEKLLVAIGVEDLIVVETDDAILVASQESGDNLKETIEKLKNQGRAEVFNHRKVYRPWGFYDCLARGEKHQVKRIVVQPGGVLSLQYHQHRSEHWVVVKGTAKVTRNSETYLVGENESTYISLGEVHRLENPCEIPLELIEIQSGSYLGEDDIVRLEDIYARVVPN